MNERAEALFENEILFFSRKIENELFGKISLEKLHLESKSSFEIINSLKQLIKKRFDFLKQIQNRKTIFENFTTSLQDIYEEVKNIIINNYNEKEFISKNKLFKQCYYNIMMFFVLIFKKFEII